MSGGITAPGRSVFTAAPVDFEQRVGDIHRHGIGDRGAVDALLALPEPKPLHETRVSRSPILPSLRVGRLNQVSPPSSLQKSMISGSAALPVREPDAGLDQTISRAIMKRNCFCSDRPAGYVHSMRIVSPSSSYTVASR
jgi:hypothetical protein